MTVRCKFRCEQVTKYEGSSTVRLTPVTSGSKENEEFFKLTPSGELHLGLVKSEVAEQFEPGKEYYLDITPAS